MHLIRAFSSNIIMILFAIMIKIAYLYFVDMINVSPDKLKNDEKRARNKIPKCRQSNMESMESMVPPQIPQRVLVFQ